MQLGRSVAVDRASQPGAGIGRPAPRRRPPLGARRGRRHVEAKPVGTIGTVLVAGSNGMTVYIFTKDVKDSGKSACTGRLPGDVAGADRPGRRDADRRRPA